MLSQEVLKKVKKIQLKITKLTNEAISGHYVSVFKGAGIEFDEVREYVPGDDIRSIDWNVTARCGSPFIKRFVEERELTVMLVVDLSASQNFGSAETLKSELAAEISALLAFLAIKNNDKVGLLIFTEQCERYLPPQKGRHHVLRVIREVLGYQPSGTGTRIGEALKFINSILKQRSIVFLISDFIDTDFENTLKHTAKKHDLVAFRLTDPREENLPEVGLIDFQDNETGARILVDTADSSIRTKVKERFNQHREAVTKLFKGSKVDFIELSTDRPYLDELQKFFKAREKRFH